MIPGNWDESLVGLPGAHILQTVEWGELKAHLGWKPIFKQWQDRDGQINAAAMVLQRQISNRSFSARLRILYAPKGPILNWDDRNLRCSVLEDLTLLARKQGAIFIKIDPDVVVGTGIPGSINQAENQTGVSVKQDLLRLGWQLSSSQIQFRNTFHINLNVDEEKLLAQMKQKTRYNIHLAQRKGVQTRLGVLSDIDMLYQMYAETSLRDGFVIREKAYYLRTWGAFLEKGLADLIIAEVDGQPVAGLVMFRFGSKAWYMYGMSRAIHREKMPTYLLQWVAMQRAKAMHCHVYDLWGAPDQFSESDPMWGVFRFKEGLGGEVVRTIGAWDHPVHRTWYFLYHKVIPHILNVLRQRGKGLTNRSLETT